VLGCSQETRLFPGLKSWAIVRRRSAACGGRIKKATSGKMIQRRDTEARRRRGSGGEMGFGIGHGLARSA
jgi:hypothetical protein